MRVLEHLKLKYISRDQSFNRLSPELMLSGCFKGEENNPKEFNIIEFFHKNWKERLFKNVLEAIDETKPETIRVEKKDLLNEEDMQNWLKSAKEYLKEYY